MTLPDFIIGSLRKIFRKTYLSSIDIGNCTMDAHLTDPCQRGFPDEKPNSHPGSGGSQDAGHLAADSGRLSSTRFCNPPLERQPVACRDQLTPFHAGP